MAQYLGCFEYDNYVRLDVEAVKNAMLSAGTEELAHQTTILRESSSLISSIIQLLESVDQKLSIKY